MLNERPESGPLADLTAHTSPPDRSSDRAFGIVIAAALLVVACWPLMAGAPARRWALVVAAAFLTLSLIRPRLLAPLNRLWTALGFYLGRIISPIMLFLVYVIAVLPTAIVLRLQKKNLLALHFDPAASTYWISRTPPGKPDASMTRQF